MALKFFIVPVRDLDAAEDELAAFVRNHRVLAIERHWVDQGSESFWAVCVDFLDTTSGGRAVASRQTTQRNKVDYKEVLSEKEFAIFARLRDLRKEIAQIEAIPVYTVFTNSQLAQIVQQRVRSVTDLSKIDGVGAARIEKYADRIISLLSQLPEPTDAADGEPV